MGFWLSGSDMFIWHCYSLCFSKEVVAYVLSTEFVLYNIRLLAVAGGEDKILHYFITVPDTALISFIFASEVIKFIL